MKSLYKKSQLVLPKLKYKLNDLSPVISEQQLSIHYQKHHQTYINNYNNLEYKPENLQLLQFNYGGHINHELFWDNLCPKNYSSTDNIKGALKNLIENQYGSIEDMKNKIHASALSVQGSGWGALTYDGKVLQIEQLKNQETTKNKVLLILDVWEHAYYLDYQNVRANYLSEIFKIVDWERVNQRFE